MPDGLNAAIFAEIEHSVNASAHGNASAISLRDAEMRKLRTELAFDLTAFFVVITFITAEVPVLTVRNRGSKIKVAQQSEVRQAYAEVMRHAIAELVVKSLFAEFRSLEIDFILKRRTVTEGDFLVKTLFSYAVFAFEGIEGRYAEVERGEREGVGGVARVLTVQGVYAEVSLSAKITRPRDGGINLALKGFVYGTGVITAVGRTGKVD